MNSLTYHQQIEKGFKDWRLPLYFSKPVLRHLLHAVDGMSSVGFTGKLTQIHQVSHHPKHRTSLGYFLQHSPWQERFLLQQTKQHIHQNLSLQSPLFLILDDTISQKTKPSLQAQSPTAACGFHFSHTDGKSVYGHQVVQLMLSDEQRAYPYDFRLYQKEENQSKIELSMELLNQVPNLHRPAYVLCDSWYTSKKIIHAALEKGHHLIGALKTNRILYPQGVGLQAKQFATFIDKRDTHVVTVGSESYHVYRYEGALRDIENGVVLLCWPVGSSLDAKQVRCFLSTDLTLSNQQILAYYSMRWRIETYFQQIKGHLGFEGVQVRSKRALLRYWLLNAFTYVFLCEMKKSPFTQTIHRVREQKFISLIEFVYVSTLQGASFEQIKNELQVA
jgi:hypothetical protein